MYFVCVQVFSLAELIFGIYFSVKFIINCSVPSTVVGYHDNFIIVVLVKMKAVQFQRSQCTMPICVHEGYWNSCFCLQQQITSQNTH